MPKHKKKYLVKSGRHLQKYWELRRGKHVDDQHETDVIPVNKLVSDDTENISLDQKRGTHVLGDLQETDVIPVNKPEDTLFEMTADINEDNLRKIELPEDGEKTPELLIEEEMGEKYVKNPEERRIVDIKYFFEEIKKISRHGGLGCDLQCLKLVGEKQTGFRSKFKFKCGMCNSVFYIENVCDKCDINNLAVAGTIAIGCGHLQLQELASALDLPLISPTVFRKQQEMIARKWEEIAEENMAKVGEEEKTLAITEGRVDENGIPIIDVVVDGCYAKRTYKKNYSSLSGAAAIVGRRTGKILYMGIKNKYCSICTQAERKKVNAKTHKCFKNFNGPSTGIESAIIVEGFRQSLEQHGLIYGRLIADGDASTYQKILDARPYNNLTVEKIECRNHLLRNLCNKLQNLKVETKYPINQRKLITKKRILTIRRSVCEAIKYNSEKKNHDFYMNILFEDILATHLHAFGNHTKCKSYFCKSLNEGDLVNEMQNNDIPNDFFTSAVWHRICYFMSNLASHSRSLIYNVDSNVVERFHSVVAKFVGGKRVNYALRGGYQTRCTAAAVSFNTKKPLSTIYKSLTGQSPRGHNMKVFEERKIKRLNLLKKYTYKKRRVPLAKKDENYGENSLRPDVSNDVMEKLKKTFVDNLKKTDEERKNIERKTILQSNSSEWLELRRSMLTASNFGRIIKKREVTSCSNLVKELLYKDNNLDFVTSIKHGRENEKLAIDQLAMQENIEIEPCGLFIDPEIPFLGATPDGLCGDETIIEIKCPITAHKMGIDQAIRKKKVNFWVQDKQGRITINKNHDWYMQVQGQLHVTRKNICLFAVWSNQNQPLKTEIIYRDDEFFEKVMKTKLLAFYKDCVLPELVDPRHTRNLPIREPQYILDAIEKKKERSKNDGKENKKPLSQIKNIDAIEKTKERSKNAVKKNKKPLSQIKNTTDHEKENENYDDVFLDPQPSCSRVLDFSTF